MTLLERSVVLVGLMGSGKTRVGAELAKVLKVPFTDSDKEIERAAGMTVAEIFERFGEQEFRSGERKVLLRLLSEGRKVIATGGGAFIQPEIRAAVKEKAVSVWLKADLDTLVERVSRTSHRPLLKNADPRAKLQELIDARYPVYAEADITIETDRRPPQEMARRIAEEIAKRVS
jgi:shikimate kinase